MTVSKGMILSYNAENRLVEAAPRNPQQGSVKSTYIYDYMGRRARKTLFTYSSGSWQKQKEISFIYDGWNMVKESEKTSDSSPEVPVYYVWGLDLSQSMQGAGGVGGLIASVRAGNEYLYSFDANGNVGQMVKSTDGSIAARYEYDPFGKTIFSEGPMAGENPYRFSTKYMDAEIGFYYYGFRFYSAEMGRWINRDPLKEGGGVNLYQFAMNNTIGRFDKLGLRANKNEDCGCCVEDIKASITPDTDFVPDEQDLSFIERADPNVKIFADSIKVEIFFKPHKLLYERDCSYKWIESHSHGTNGGKVPGGNIPTDVTSSVKSDAPGCVEDWPSRLLGKVVFTDYPFDAFRKAYGGKEMHLKHTVKIEVYSGKGIRCKNDSVSVSITREYFWAGGNLADARRNQKIDYLYNRR